MSSAEDRKKLSFHKAASMERSCWMAKLRRMRQLSSDPGWLSAVDEMVAFGRKRVERYERKPGGLKGRKGK